MRTQLCTGFDSNMKRIGRLTSRLISEYADKNGFDFLCCHSSPDGLLPNWICICAAISAFRAKYDRFIWIEADQVVTNMHYKIQELSPGIHISRDWGPDAEDADFSTCAFIAFPDSLPIFEMLLDMEPEWRDKPFPCQAPMRHLRKTNAEAKNTIHVHPRRFLNAVPRQVDKHVVEPWHEGDWLCHLTNSSQTQRVKLFMEVKGIE